jgi:hypothetical protein
VTTVALTDLRELAGELGSGRIEIYESALSGSYDRGEDCRQVTKRRFSDVKASAPKH